MPQQDGHGEQRKHQRSPVEFPVVYKVGGTTLTGSTLNASNEGILVESCLSAKTAFKVFKVLNRKPGYRLKIEYSYGGNTYLRDAEVKHFRLDFSGGDPYHLRIGFWIPKIV